MRRLLLLFTAVPKKLRSVQKIKSNKQKGGYWFPCASIDPSKSASFKRNLPKSKRYQRSNVNHFRQSALASEAFKICDFISYIGIRQLLIYSSDLRSISFVPKNRSNFENVSISQLDFTG